MSLSITPDSPYIPPNVVHDSPSPSASPLRISKKAERILKELDLDNSQVSMKHRENSVWLYESLEILQKESSSKGSEIDKAKSLLKSTLLNRVTSWYQNNPIATYTEVPKPAQTELSEELPKETDAQRMAAGREIRDARLRRASRRGTKHKKDIAVIISRETSIESKLIAMLTKEENNVPFLAVAPPDIAKLGLRLISTLKKEDRNKLQSKLSSIWLGSIANKNYRSLNDYTNKYLSKRFNQLSQIQSSQQFASTLQSQPVKEGAGSLTEEQGKQLVESAQSPSVNVMRYHPHEGDLKELGISKLDLNLTEKWTVDNELEVLRMLLQGKSKEARRVFINQKDEQGLTPLLKCTDARVAEALLDAGADPNIRDPEGLTLLHRAIRDHNTVLAKELTSEAFKDQIDINARAGLDPKAKTGFTPLLLAMESSQFDLAMHMINNGANVTLSGGPKNIKPETVMKVIITGQEALIKSKKSKEVFDGKQASKDVIKNLEAELGQRKIVAKLIKDKTPGFFDSICGSSSNKPAPKPSSMYTVQQISLSQSSDVASD